MRYAPREFLLWGGARTTLSALIAALFANGEEGLALDVSDMSTMFQDSAGTIPVTAVEQPVGLRLDKRKGLVLGPELITNGAFTADTNWTKGAGWTVSGGGANFSAGTDSSDLAQVIGVPIIGRAYRINVSLTHTSGGAVRAIYGNALYTLPTASGTYSFILIANSAPESAIRFRALTGASVFSVDNISVKELPGNHAFQATNGSRANLSARVNRLIKSEDIADVAWSKLATGTGSTPVVTANYSMAPDGTMTADRVQFALNGGTSSADQSNIYQSPPVTPSTSYTHIFWIKTNDGSTKLLQFRDDNALTASQIMSITPVWQKFTFSGTSSVAAISANFRLWLRGGQGTSDSADVSLWACDFRPTNQNSLPYQRVNTATDYDTVGFPLYLKYDGVDDFYQTSAINFTGTDKMTVVAGVRKLSDATAQIICELTTSVTSTDGGFYLAVLTSAANTYGFATRGTVVSVSSSFAPYVAPHSASLVAQYDNAGNGTGTSAQIRARINGVAVGPNASATTAGPFANAPFYIGARAGVSLRFSGQEYGIILRGVLSTPSQVEDIERYLNSKM